MMAVIRVSAELPTAAVAHVAHLFPREIVRLLGADVSSDHERSRRHARSVRESVGVLQGPLRSIVERDPYGPRGNRSPVKKPDICSELTEVKPAADSIAMCSSRSSGVTVYGDLSDPSSGAASWYDRMIGPAGSADKANDLNAASCRSPNCATGVENRPRPDWATT